MNRLGLLLVIVVAAACGPRPVPAPIESTSPPPTPQAAIGPGPKINWIADHFETVDLPAISEDRSKVVYAYMGEDGARGEPNLAVMVKDVTDTVINKLVVLKIDEDIEAVNEPTLQMLEDANRYLADTHAAFTWETMLAAEVDGGGEGRTAVVGGIDVAFTPAGHVVVRDGDIVVLERDFPAWLVKDSPMGGEPYETCSNPAFLSAAWISASKNAALLKISYMGNDSCWEPDSTMHVIVWDAAATL
jgi:hypothetical protein